MISDEELLTAVTGIIDAERDVIASYVGDDLGLKGDLDFKVPKWWRARFLKQTAGNTCEFCYMVQNGSTMKTRRRCWSMPGSAPEAEMEHWRQVADNKALLLPRRGCCQGAPTPRRAPSGKTCKLVVKSTVLLRRRGGVRHGPYAVWLGKIAAAAAVSVAAGVVASTLMTSSATTSTVVTKGNRSLNG
jgi:hypothetical protein